MHSAPAAGAPTVGAPGNSPGLLTTRSGRIVAARKLQRRRERARAGEFLAEGPQAVREALLAGAVVELYCAQPDLLTTLPVGPTPAYQVEPAVIAALAESLTPQGVVARCRWRAPTADLLSAPGALCLLAHAVSEPGNAGALIRVADAAGAQFVVLGAGSVDPTNAKCVRASAGSLFHLPVASGLELRTVIAQLRGQGVRVLAADVTPAAVDLFKMSAAPDFARPTAWLFGNEAHGLPTDLLAACDAVARIPIYGRAESLNLATAAAVCLYASAQASRRAQAPPT